MTGEARRVVKRVAHMSQGAVAASDEVRVPPILSAPWVWGESTGAGVEVCLVDSGVNPEGVPVPDNVTTMRVVADEEAGGYAVVEEEAVDAAGHGTACAHIIQTLAPDCRITSVRVLGPRLDTSGDVLIAALEWAVERRFGLVNLSLSTSRDAFKERLRHIADQAYFRKMAIVASAHNNPVTSYPWAFASVISVGSHDATDPEYIEYNPEPPVAFYAKGIDVPVQMPDGRAARVTGNSFATPHVTGLCARVLAKHPGISPAHLRAFLGAAAGNVA